MDDGLSRCTLHGLVLLWPGFDIFVWKYSLIVWIFFIDFLKVFGKSWDGFGSFLVISVCVFFLAGGLSWHFQMLTFLSFSTFGFLHLQRRYLSCLEAK